MNRIERKLLNKYNEFTAKSGSNKGFFTALVIDFEDDNKITKYRFSIGYSDPANDAGTNLPRLTVEQDNQVFFLFTDFNDAVSTVSQLDFLPEDFDTEEDYKEEVLKYTDKQEDIDYYFNSGTFFAILDVEDFSTEA